ncbi:MAG: hypothetical protein COA79_16040 [Planctomycetota bacterium]|nr:MAG: hypothetical protein COA79_16040 [Planctomycetota bacterium]
MQKIKFSQSLISLFRLGSCCFIMFFLITTVNAENIKLIDEKSLWKKQYVYITPKVSEKSAKAAGKPIDAAFREKLLAKGVVVLGYKPQKILHGFITSQLPQKWQEVDFDDTKWHNAKGTNLSKGSRRVPSRLDPRFVRGTDPFVFSIGLMAQRGKFIVRDPSKVKKLTLNLVYRGGFIAFLNGKKIASRSLPKGVVSFNTPADDYPLGAFVTKNAKGKPSFFDFYKHRSKEYIEQWAKRERISGTIELDPKDLVKGVNVLSLELHRSDFPIECAKKKIGLGFSPIGLAVLSLNADTSKDNVVSACVNTAAVRVWSANTWQTLTKKSFGNPADELKKLSIVGAKNGSFVGQLIISSPNAIEGISLKTGSLKSGAGEIKAENITCKYGDLNSFYRKSDRFDLLLDTPPAKLGKVLPIWIFVKVPKNIAAGVFKGLVEVSLKGSKMISIPIEVSVSDWALPDVKDFTPITVIYESTDSLAKHYKVEAWSEKHWSMIETSLKLMGEFGNCGLLIPLLAESCMGNPESMIVWSKQADGTYKHDFKNFDRYMKIAMKYHSLDRLKMISLNVWGYENATTKKKKAPGSKITVKDASGKNTNILLPTSGSSECEAMWKPLLLGIQTRLKKYKLEDRIMFGLGGDKMPDFKQAAMFNRILPGTPWFRESHFPLITVRTDAEDKSKTVGVGITSMVWGEGVPSPAKKRLYGWKYNPKNIKTNFKRELDGYNPLWDFRQWMENTIVGGRNGNTRFGGDFYNLGINLKTYLSKEDYKKLGYDSRRAQGTLFNTYPDSNVAQTALAESVPDIFGAGINGPVTTMRFENARLGNQEAEARIAIEKAILEKKLTPELEKKCQEFLDTRTNAMQLWFSPGRKVACAGWQASNKKLFDLAGEVVKSKK